MSIAAMVEALVKTGATSEMILAAIRAVENEQIERAAITREQARQRKIKQRQKEKSLENNDRVTVTTVTSVTPPLSPDGFLSTPILPLPLSPKENPPKGGQKKNPVEADEFYQRYPRKVGKQAALKAYQAARTKTTHETIMAGLERFIRFGNFTDPHFVKHPATWLNHGCWADEYPDKKPEVPPPRRTLAEKYPMPSAAGG